MQSHLQELGNVSGLCVLEWRSTSLRPVALMEKVILKLGSSREKKHLKCRDAEIQEKLSNTLCLGSVTVELEHHEVSS